MNQIVATAAPEAAASPDIASIAGLKAARSLLLHLQKGQRIDAPNLRQAMEDAYDSSDTSGVWTWKLAYDICEAALVLFLRQYGSALMSKAGSVEAVYRCLFAWQL